MAGGAYLLLKQPLYQSDCLAGAAFRQSVGAEYRSHDDTRPATRDPMNIGRFCIPTPTSCAAPDLTRGVISTIGLARLYPQIAAMP